MAATATSYALFATALETTSIRESPGKSRTTLTISRLYPGDDDAAFTQWLDEWLRDRIKTPRSRICADLKSLWLASTRGKGPIVLVWAVTYLALICGAGDIAIPGVFERRDLPCLLDQAERPEYPNFFQSRDMIDIQIYLAKQQNNPTHAAEAFKHYRKEVVNTVLTRYPIATPAEVEGLVHQPVDVSLDNSSAPEFDFEIPTAGLIFSLGHRLLENTAAGETLHSAGNTNVKDFTEHSCRRANLINPTRGFQLLQLLSFQVLSRACCGLGVEDERSHLQQTYENFARFYNRSTWQQPQNFQALVKLSAAWLLLSDTAIVWDLDRTQLPIPDLGLLEKYMGSWSQAEQYIHRLQTRQNEIFCLNLAQVDQFRYSHASTDDAYLIVKFVVLKPSYDHCVHARRNGQQAMDGFRENAIECMEAALAHLCNIQRQDDFTRAVTLQRHVYRTLTLSLANYNRELHLIELVGLGVELGLCGNEASKNAHSKTLNFLDTFLKHYAGKGLMDKVRADFNALKPGCGQVAGVEDSMYVPSRLSERFPSSPMDSINSWLATESNYICEALPPHAEPDTPLSEMQAEDHRSPAILPVSKPTLSLPEPTRRKRSRYSKTGCDMCSQVDSGG
ncbi:hypothetical protein PWT90_03431 [Aphanocladium album]|nr:hypothetical protein PWT90_03431 [Aphanocladium album]